MSEKQAEEKAGKRHGTRGILHPKMKAKQIKPGEVRNPTGRPKGKNLTTLLKEIGNESTPKEYQKYGKTWYEVIARNAFKMALKQHPYFKSILDLEREGAELLTEFLELVNRYGITKEQIKADPILLEAAIRCGYITDSESENGTPGTGKDNTAAEGTGETP